MPDERERQTSNKAGLKSLGKKMSNARYGFDEHPASKKTAGAFAHEERIKGRARGKEASLDRMKDKL